MPLWDSFIHISRGPMAQGHILVKGLDVDQTNYCHPGLKIQHKLAILNVNVNL